MRVNESGAARLGVHNIRISPNWTRQLDLRPDQIEFEIVSSPKHGQLIARRSDNLRVFTLQDLADGLLEYRHNGAENQSDYIELRISLPQHRPRPLSPYKELPSRATFVLPIAVSPRNDEPSVQFPSGAEASIVTGGRLRITRRIFQALDPEESPAALNWIVDYETGVSPSTSGFFVKSSRPTEKLLTFSQEEIDRGQILFCNRGSSTDVVRVRVYDGVAYSANMQFVFRGVSIDLDVGINTGLRVRPGGETLLTRQNLSVVTNNRSTAGLVRFEVRQKARYGVLQAWNFDSERWEGVQVFTQKQINEGRVKFVGTYLKPEIPLDKFSFVVSNSLRETKEQEFHVTYTTVIIDLVRNRRLELFGNPIGAITSDLLLAKTRNVADGPSLIAYQIRSKAKGGYVFRRRNGRREMLGVGSRFTQENIDSGELHFWFRMVTHEVFEDSFRFRVEVVGGQSPVHHFRITYRPKPRSFRLINRGLNGVMEGGNATVTPSMLWMSSSIGDKFVFRVTEPPRHGQLQLIEPRERTVVRAGVTDFKASDIRSKLLVYQHDDSESELDDFRFEVKPTEPSSTESGKTINQVFRIRIDLKNDNAPEVVASGPLNMTLNSSKILSPDILKSIDRDIDFDPDKLTYRWLTKGVRNGYFYKPVKGQHIPINFFTQVSPGFWGTVLLMKLGVLGLSFLLSVKQYDIKKIMM